MPARTGTAILVRVVDEYDGATLARRKQQSASEPLSLGELVEFFLRVWDLCAVLQMNFEEHGYPRAGCSASSGEARTSIPSSMTSYVAASGPSSGRRMRSYRTIPNDPTERRTNMALKFIVQGKYGPVV